MNDFLESLDAMFTIEEIVEATDEAIALLRAGEFNAVHGPISRIERLSDRLMSLGAARGSVHARRFLNKQYDLLRSVAIAVKPRR